MDATHFAYWLQGYVEITNGQLPNSVQWQIIRDHLQEVFVKTTPNRQQVSHGVILQDSKPITAGYFHPTGYFPECSIAFY